MNIYVKGHISCYELEHVARLFYPKAAVGNAAHGAEVVAARLSAHHMLAAVRLNGKCTVRLAKRDLSLDAKQLEYAHSLMLFNLLCDVTATRPAWGMLTGVRPVRLIHDMHRKNMPESEIEAFFKQKFLVSDEKYALAQKIAATQAGIIAKNKPRSYSLYIGIPFCPSRCSYCSFVSRTTAESAALIQPYVDALCAEIEDIKATAERNKLTLETIYIGGGTPTSLTAKQLETLMNKVAECFDLSAVSEYTVEAGRPDCTDFEKLCVIKNGGATRISINPQTLSDNVLEAIGRKHTAQDILNCFADARKAGHTNINMDLIAGLPKDTVSGFEKSLDGVIALSPENITVHTLTLKRASSIVIDNEADAYDDVAKMVSLSSKKLADAGYAPYYLYRQKGTLQNLENTGYTKSGSECLYNIYIMEEVHTILSAGAGGSTKLVKPGEKIARIFNYKYPLEYLSGADEMHQRKKGVDDFYAKYFDMDT